MNKPLEDWDIAYIESLDVTERTSPEIKRSECLENLGKTIGDVVSAFANIDGGHIIVGARDPLDSTAIVPDGKLSLGKGKQGLKEWLETKIYRLSDPPVSTFDVKEFSFAEDSLAVIEIRTSVEAAGAKSPPVELWQLQYEGLLGGTPRLAYPPGKTSFAIVKKVQLTRPELAFIIVTRAMIGAGIALLFADRLNAEQRKAVGATLATVGLVTTIPAVWAIFGKCE